MNRVQFASAVHVDTDSHRAWAQVTEAIHRELPDPDLVVVFAAPVHFEFLEQNPAWLAGQWGSAQLLGCTAESVIHGQREYEGEPAIAVWAARLPGARLDLHHIAYERLGDNAYWSGGPLAAESAGPAGGFVLLLAEPLSFPVEPGLGHLAEIWPEIPVVGGVASARPGSNRLLFGRTVVENGAVAARVRGAIRCDVLVSQGCRPVGEPCVVTKAHGNEIWQLRGQPALEYLQELFEALPTRDQRLINEGLQIGRVISEYQDRRGWGDFLIRGVLGANPDTQALVLGDIFRTGQTVQFHVRDHASADLDLRQRLKSLLAERGAAAAVGGLLFTCNGRGSNLFPEPDHDAAAIQQIVGPLPLAGFFAAGEIGPVGGENFVHGYTACLLVVGGTSG